MTPEEILELVFSKMRDAVGLNENVKQQVKKQVLNEIESRKMLSVTKAAETVNILPTSTPVIGLTASAPVGLPNVSNLKV